MMTATDGIDAIAALAQGARGADADGRRAEFVQLVRQAAALRAAAPEPAGGAQPR